MPRNDTCTIECKIINERPRAVLIEVPDGPKQRQVWLPLSTVHEIHRTRDGATIVCDSWIARKESLE
ncbi:hypothetical protein KW797_03255 [Candidatus Parcubacteria bacterium]|nr:hypothetical protein [Candidatus Parcubacteria bacterium]